MVIGCSFTRPIWSICHDLSKRPQRMSTNWCFIAYPLCKQHSEDTSVSLWWGTLCKTDVLQSNATWWHVTQRRHHTGCFALRYRPEKAWSEETFWKRRMHVSYRWFCPENYSLLCAETMSVFVRIRASDLAFFIQHILPFCENTFARSWIHVPIKLAKSPVRPWSRNAVYSGLVPDIQNHYLKGMWRVSAVQFQELEEFTKKRWQGTINCQLLDKHSEIPIRLNVAKDAEQTTSCITKLADLRKFIQLSLEETAEKRALQTDYGCVIIIFVGFLLP